MKNKIKRAIYILLAAFVWISAWELLAKYIDHTSIFPTFTDTLKVFLSLIVTKSFWSIVFSSIIRILLGFIIGSTLGILIAPLTHRFEFARILISPAMTVIKSTPVASFILVLWCIIGRDSVPTAIGVLMVMPIVWQNLSDGLDSIDLKLAEVCDIFEISKWKWIKLLILPTLIRFLLPALVTSSALAWKSGIAAEIIAYTKNSIGREISNAKSFFESANMFAWTIAVILLSIAIEILIKRLAMAVKKI